MLSGVRLKNFKNHLNTGLRLESLTCLVGPNGCGKTGVLEGIQFACTTLAHGAVAFFRPSSDFRDFIRKGAEGFSVELDSKGGEGQGDRLHVQLNLSKGHWSFSKDEWPGEPPDFNATCNWETNWDREAALKEWSKSDGNWPSGIFAKDGAGDNVTIHSWEPRGLLPEFEVIVPKSFLFSPSVTRLRAPSYSREEIPTIAPDGTNLSSVIAYLITTEPELFAELLQRVREVLPAVERLRVRPAKVELVEPTTITVNRKEIPYTETREVIGHELLFDLVDAPGIPARAVSEGTLLVTALLTAVTWNRGVDVLMIDDLERGLHPKAQRELVISLKTLLAGNPDLQIVFSTHSPYVVDELTADQVRVLVPDHQRGVVACSLDEHPRAREAMQVLTTGEFLDAEGEDWVLEKAAAG